jgi:potassium-transporting ATPase potassium-binding subunit
MISFGEIIQILVFLAALVICTPLLGKFIAKIMSRESATGLRFLDAFERGVYKLFGVSPSESMTAKQYTIALLAFNAMGIVVVFLLQMFQGSLPFHGDLPRVSWHLALNTAVSFVTNTNWQSYAGETTLSAFVQMTGLTVQNFVSAATGIAVMFALTRGIMGRTTKFIGNFWSDLVRSTLYILLPFSIVLAVILTGEGVVQSFSPNVPATTVEGATQIIPLGPVASQIAIKQLGTNGGGYFNANSAHPFENPTPLTNFLELLAILLLPSALVYAYGVMTGSKKHARVLWSVMMFLLVSFLAISLSSEFSHGSMEGKELRFGMPGSVVWSVATTAASNGSVNAMHDSLSPLSGFIAMLNMMLGEIVFGGVGAGMYGMLVFILLTVFIAGLMVGRTPEYLGKKIEAKEITMASLAVLLPSAAILIFTAIAAIAPAGLAGLNNAGPHGLSEMLYAFTSAAANNGSAFAGLNANTMFYNVLLALGMLVGRFGVIIPMLSVAGSLAQKKFTPPGSGTFPTDTLLFAGLLIGVILIVGALTFFPALTLGPIVEHLLLQAGRMF